MKWQISSVILLAALAISVSQGSAQQQVPQAAPRKAYSPQNNPANRANARSATSQTSTYREHEANSLPFGSEQWWDQMNREGRARN
jgi:hypothetical protein